MSINIEAFRKGKDYICVHNKVYTMEEYIERVDILEAQIEELKAKNERLRIRIKKLERIAKIQSKEEQCEDVGYSKEEQYEDVGYSPDGRPGLPFCWTVGPEKPKNKNKIEFKPQPLKCENINAWSML